MQEGGDWGHDLHGVDTTIHDLDNLIQNHKRRLQTGQLHKRLHGAGIRLPTPLDLLPALAQPRQSEIVVALRRVALELGQEDTGDVLLLGANAEARLLGRLLDLVADVAAHGVRHLCEREGGDLHDAAHFALRFVDAAGDF